MALFKLHYAVREPEEGIYQVVVLPNDFPLLRTTQKWMAESIAWTLNALEDGYELSAEHPDKVLSWTYDPDWMRTYDGEKP